MAVELHVYECALSKRIYLWIVFIDEFVDMVMKKNVVKQNNYIAMLAAKSSQDYHNDKVCYTFSFFLFCSF